MVSISVRLLRDHGLGVKRRSRHSDLCLLRVGVELRWSAWVVGFRSPPQKGGAVLGTGPEWPAAVAAGGSEEGEEDHRYKFCWSQLKVLNFCHLWTVFFISQTHNKWEHLLDFQGRRGQAGQQQIQRYKSIQITGVFSKITLLQISLDLS